MKEHVGDINAFLAKRDVESFREFEINKKTAEKKENSGNKKNLYKLKKELKNVENRISKIEQKIANFDARLKDYDEYQKIQEEPNAFKDHEMNQNTLDELMVRWEKLTIEME